MARNRSRRATVLGFTASATVLALTSTAFACTSMWGSLKVSDTPVQPGVPNQAFVDGAGGGHEYCGVAPEAVEPIAYPNQRSNALAGRVVDLTGAFTVQVGQTTTCLGAQNDLSDAGSKYTSGSVWDIWWLNTTGKSPLSVNCWTGGPRTAGGGDDAVDVGNITISTSGGVAQGTATATAPTGTGSQSGIGRVEICVDKQGANINDGTRVSPPSLFLDVI